MAAEPEKCQESCENSSFCDLSLTFRDEDIDCIQTIRKRETCGRCRRPVAVCWCVFLPKIPIHIETTVYILQHPNEEKRPLSTTPMLPMSIEQGKCHVIKGKKFKAESKPDVVQMLLSPNTVLLYPSPNATDVADLPKSSQPYNLVVLDGTWSQAKTMYNQNEVIRRIRPVTLSGTTKSEYVVRTQPMDGCLSTVESTAIALSHLEGNPDLKEVFMQPLRALCKFQLDHGAVEHQSKAWLIENGLYKKQVNDKKRNNGSTSDAKRERNSKDASESCVKIQSAIETDGDLFIDKHVHETYDEHVQETHQNDELIVHTEKDVDSCDKKEHMSCRNNEIKYESRQNKIS
ncbi:tRNA-uridine aminocarboxypropyltransferase 2-like [Lineus longissimus]|uniref:tRNA-uridine aminocarboxypropyltransferase 2-like n=1 Tax=Lineus longissimus TaxID=88925 RepID=UPI002B4D743A